MEHKHIIRQSMLATLAGTLLYMILSFIFKLEFSDSPYNLEVIKVGCTIFVASVVLLKLEQ